MHPVLLLSANRVLSRPLWTEKSYRRVQTRVGRETESQYIQLGQQGLTICFRSRTRRSDGSPLAPRIHYRLIPGNGQWTEVPGEPMQEAWWLPGGWFAIRFPESSGDDAVEFVICEDGRNKWVKTKDGSNFLVPLNHGYICVAPDTSTVHRVSEGAPVLLVSDMDGTMLGDEAASRQFRTVWNTAFAPAGGVLAFSTGRTFQSATDVIRDLGKNIAEPDVLITQVGTAIHQMDPFTGMYEVDHEYQAYLRASMCTLPSGFSLEDTIAMETAVERFTGEEAHDVLKRLDNRDNSEFKWSCLLNAKYIDVVRTGMLTWLGHDNVKIFVSGVGDWMFFDVIASGGGKFNALKYVQRKAFVGDDRVIACGDSGNDLDMLVGAAEIGGVGIVVGNAQQGLLDAIYDDERVFDGSLLISNDHMAAGILEGLRRASIWEE